MQTVKERFHRRLDDEEVDFLAAVEEMTTILGEWFTIHQGFDRINFDGDCMLVVTEIAEAVEADRKAEVDNHCPEHMGRTVELADALVRILHIASKYNLNLGPAFMAKMRVNLERPVKHGKDY